MTLDVGLGYRAVASECSLLSLPRVSNGQLAAKHGSRKCGVKTLKILGRVPLASRSLRPDPCFPCLSDV